MAGTPEQRRIVADLDDLYPGELLRNRQVQVNVLATLRQSRGSWWGAFQGGYSPLRALTLSSSAASGMPTYDS